MENPKKQKIEAVEVYPISKEIEKEFFYYFKGTLNGQKVKGYLHVN